MRISAAVTTAPRETSYLRDTLESLHQAGFEYPLVIRDGRPLLGAKPTFKRAIWSLRGAEWMLIFQDDIVVARGLRRWLITNLNGCYTEGPQHAVYSLYCATPHDGPDGWRRIDLDPKPSNTLPWHNSLGACALLMPGDVALAFLERDPAFSRTDRIGGAIGQFCHQTGVPFIVHSPSLVQHTGEISCRAGVPITDERRAKRFCDDVRSLGGFADVAETAAHPCDSRAPATVPTNQGSLGLVQRVPADA